jgi:hypothetical protein
MERETFVGGCFRDFRTSSVTAREHRQYSIRCVLGEDGLCVCIYLPADTHCMNLYPLSSGTFTMSPCLLHYYIYTTVLFLLLTIPLTWVTAAYVIRLPRLTSQCSHYELGRGKEETRQVQHAYQKNMETDSLPAASRCGYPSILFWPSFHSSIFPRTRPSVLLVSTWTGRTNGLRILKSWNFCLPSNPVHESTRCNQTFNACGHMCCHTFNNYDLIDYLGWWYLWWQKKTCYGIL